MIHIHELNHVLLNVRDLEASVRFYGTVLELPRLPRPAFDFPGAWFAAGKQDIHLIGDPKLTPASRHHHHFAFRVDDPFAVRAILEAKGLRGMQGPSPRPDGAMQLFLADPDGYIIEFFAFPPRQRFAQKFGCPRAQAKETFVAGEGRKPTGRFDAR